MVVAEDVSYPWTPKLSVQVFGIRCFMVTKFACSIEVRTSGGLVRNKDKSGTAPDLLHSQDLVMSGPGRLWYPRGWSGAAP